MARRGVHRWVVEQSISLHWFRRLLILEIRDVNIQPGAGGMGLADRFRAGREWAASRVGR